MTIIHNPGLLVEQAPVLRLVEDLRIGAIEGPPGYEFEHLSDVAVGNDGEIVAVDSRARSVRVFSPEGVLLREFGGRGGGPGEFPTGPNWVWLAGDSMLVQDRHQFHLFTLNGEFLSATRPTPLGTRALLGRAPQGWLMGQSFSSPPPSAQERTRVDSFRIVQVDLSDGSFGPPILEIPETPVRYLGDGDMAVAQVLGPRVHAALRPNGEIYATNGRDYEINVHSRDGTLRKRIRAVVKRVPVTEEEFEEVLDQARSALGFKEMKALGHPEVRPIPGRLFVSQSGRFLMERRDLMPVSSMMGPRYIVTWDLFDSDGRIAGRFTTDERTLPTRLTDGFLYAIVRGEFDVQYVVRYRLSA